MTNIHEKDLNSISLSASAKDFLEKLESDGIINEQLDGFRFAISIAIKFNLEPLNIQSNTAKIWSPGQIDPDNTIRKIISILKPQFSQTPTRGMVQLAEAGINQIIHDKKSTQLEYYFQ